MTNGTSEKQGAQIKAREDRARRALRKDGELLRKSRRASTGGAVYRNGVYQGQNIDDYGGYMIVSERNTIVAGPRFDLTLEDVEAYIRQGQE